MGIHRKCGSAKKNQKVSESECLKRVKEKQELEVTARITVWFLERQEEAIHQHSKLQGPLSLRDFSAHTLLEVSISTNREQIS